MNETTSIIVADLKIDRILFMHIKNFKSKSITTTTTTTTTTTITLIIEKMINNTRN